MQKTRRVWLNRLNMAHTRSSPLLHHCSNRNPSLRHHFPIIIPSWRYLHPSGHAILSYMSPRLQQLAPRELRANSFHCTSIFFVWAIYIYIYFCNTLKFQCSYISVSIGVYIYIYTDVHFHCSSY